MDSVKVLFSGASLKEKLQVAEEIFSQATGSNGVKSLPLVLKSHYLRQLADWASGACLGKKSCLFPESGSPAALIC